MPYRVFSQAEYPELPLGALGGAGDVSVTLVRRVEAAPLPTADVSIERRGHDAPSTFRLTARPTTETDRRDAADAARRGSAAGMDLLAARCPTVIDVHDDGTPSATLRYALLSALAAHCLGPVLPPDGATLLGVRSAQRLATGRVTR